MVVGTESQPTWVLVVGTEPNLLSVGGRDGVDGVPTYVHKKRVNEFRSPCFVVRLLLPQFIARFGG